MRFALDEANNAYLLLVVLISLDYLYSKFSKRHEWSFLCTVYTWSIVVVLLLPSTELCYDFKQTNQEIVTQCYSYEKETLLYLPTLVYFVYMKLFVREKYCEPNRYGQYYNNIFLNRQLVPKNLKIYIPLEILQLGCLFFVSNDLFKFLQNGLYGGKSKQRAAYHIIKSISNPFKATDAVLDLAKCVLHNIVQIAHKVSYFPYLFCNFILYFPGISFFTLDFVGIFTLNPTELVQLCRRELFMKNCTRKMYTDGLDYYFLKANDKKVQELRELSVEELKSICITSTFNLQRGFKRILKGV